MLNKAKSLWLLLAGLLLVLAACGPSQPVATQTVDPNAVFTAAAQTANAKMTEMAALSPSAAPATATATLSTPTATSATASATTPSPAAATSTTSSTGGSSAQGDSSQYVSDVSVPDGTNFNANEAFTKTWKLQNMGTTTWTTAYKLVHVDGNAMTSSTSVPLPNEVGPGQTVDISVNMTAPASSGNYKGYWRLSNAQGTPFGTVIYVDINVVGGTGTPSVTPGTGTPGATATPGASGTPGATATGTASGSSGTTVTDVSISVDQGTVAGACPHTFTFPAEFTLTKDAKVTYRLEAGSNTAGFEITLPEPTTTNLQAGTHTFNYTLEFSATVAGWARLHVIAPENVSSPDVAFSLTCQ
jgi:hypothetical protein